MKKSVCVLAVLAAAVSTSAVAKDLKQKQVPTVSATQMTNSEMDKVTAGAQGGQGNGFGEGTGAPGNGKGQGGGLLGHNNFRARF
jgi:opacity protein-like surface antigen